jgi:hypothetical protein
MSSRAHRLFVPLALGWVLVVVALWGLNGLWASSRFLGSDPVTILRAGDPAVLDPPLMLDGFRGLSSLDPGVLAGVVLPDLAWLALFVSACGLVGGLLIRPLLHGLARLERAVLAFGAGSVVLGLLLLALALLGWFRPAPVLGVQLGCAGVGALGLLLARWRLGALEPPPPLSLGPPILVALLGLAVMLLLLLGKLYVVDVDPDSMEFHRVAINQILRTGRLDICLENYAANRPLQLELFQAVAFDDRPLAQGIQALFTVMAALAVAGLVLRRGGLAVGLVAALIYLCDHSVLWRVAVHANENCLGFYSLLGLVALALFRERRQGGWLVLGALLLGFSVGTYYLGLLTATAGAGVVLLLERDGWRPRWKPLLVFCGVAGLAMAPWLLRNLLQLHNPVFPLLFDWFGGRGLNPTSEYLHSAMAQRGLFIDRSVASFLLAPFGWPKRELFNALMLLLWPLALLAGRRPAALLGLWALGYYALWFVLLPQDRFLLPVLPALAALAGLGLAGLRERLGERGRALLWTGLLSATLVTVGLRVLEQGGIVAHSLARVSQPQPGSPAPGELSSPLIQTVNGQLPPDAVLAGVSNGFFDKPSYTILPVGFFDLATMQDTAGIDAALAERGVTHLVIPTEGGPEWRHWAGFDDPIVHGFTAALRDYLQRRCEPCMQREAWRVCAIRGGAGAQGR